MSAFESKADIARTRLNVPLMILWTAKREPRKGFVFQLRPISYSFSSRRCNCTLKTGVTLSLGMSDATALPSKQQIG
jgi:hypothetical protein